MPLPLKLWTPAIAANDGHDGIGIVYGADRWAAICRRTIELQRLQYCLVGSALMVLFLVIWSFTAARNLIDWS